ncbi:hypothetical protein SESBI_47050 [Sesbania bispinosa]|nr:hypothetical protein SESBI_47050 [Sesbania bispinosa]
MELKCLMSHGNLAITKRTFVQSLSHHILVVIVLLFHLQTLCHAQPSPLQDLQGCVVVSPVQQLLPPRRSHPLHPVVPKSDTTSRRPFRVVPRPQMATYRLLP